MIHVRRASLDDLEAMIASYTAAWRKGFRYMFSESVFMRDDFDQKRREECLASVLHDDVDTFVVELEGRVVGFVVSRRRAGVATVDDLWLHPASWGCGGAAALISRIEDDHRAVGGQRLNAWVPEDSPRGRRFFEKLGWRATCAIEMLTVYPNDANRIFEYERPLI